MKSNASVPIVIPPTTPVPSELGTGVVGGMVVGTLALLFVVPVFYIIFEYLQEKIRKPMEEEPDVQVLLEKEKSEVERERK